MLWRLPLLVGLRNDMRPPMVGGKCGGVAACRAASGELGTSLALAFLKESFSEVTADDALDGYLEAWLLIRATDAASF